MSYRLLLVCLLTASVLSPSSQPALAGPIYVFKEADGSTRFSSKPPPRGIQAQVFTGSKANFSIYRARPFGGFHGGKLFRNIYGEAIKKAALAYSLDPSLIKAVIHVESAFNARAVSPKGARGLMQLMPGTAQMLGVKNSFQPDQNIDGGSKHLARLVEKFNGNVSLALAAYNAGENAVDRYKGIPPYQETRLYVKRVLEMHRRYRAIT